MSAPGRKVSPLTPQFVYDGRSQRYVSRQNGRFVSGRQVRQVVDTVVARSHAEVAALSRRLVAGGVTLPQWQRGMEKHIKMLHLASTATARGGWHQLTKSDLKGVSSVVKREYGHLAVFAGKLATGEQPLNGQVVSRSVQYAEAARNTYEVERLDVEKDAGLEEEMNELEPGSHSCDECISLSEMGWVEIGTLPLPGDRECRRNCNCQIRRRKGQVEE